MNWLFKTIKYNKNYADNFKGMLLKKRTLIALHWQQQSLAHHWQNKRRKEKKKERKTKNERKKKSTERKKNFITTKTYKQELQ